MTSDRNKRSLRRNYIFLNTEYYINFIKPSAVDLLKKRKINKNIFLTIPALCVGSPKTAKMGR